MRKILTLPKWIVSSFDPETQSRRETKPLPLAEAKEAKQQAKLRGWKKIRITSESGMDFTNRPKKEVEEWVEPDPFSCCGRKLRHAHDCWVIGGNVDQPSELYG